MGFVLNGYMIAVVGRFVSVVYHRAVFTAEMPVKAFLFEHQYRRAESVRARSAFDLEFVTHTIYSYINFLSCLKVAAEYRRYRKF